MSQSQPPFWKPRPTATRLKGAPTEPRALPADDPPMPEITERYIADDEERSVDIRLRLYKTEGLINLLFGGLTWMIGFRMILEFLNADISKIIVKFAYALTTPFMLPFVGITPGFPFGPFLIDVSGFIAIFFYAMFTWLITKGMWLLLDNPRASNAPARTRRTKSAEFRIR